jgi:hypothetical protein
MKFVYLALIAAVAILVGSWSAFSEKTGPVSQAQPSAELPDKQPSTMETARSSPTPATKEEHAAIVSKQPNTSGMLEDLRTALNAEPSAAQEAKIETLLLKIQKQAMHARDALHTVMAAMLRDPDSPFGSRLGDILGGIKDHDVERMAQAMARSQDGNQLRAGLDLLGRLEMPSKETYEIASQVLNDVPAHEPEILMLAVQALPNSSLSVEQTEQSIKALSQLTSPNENDGVRSNSLFKISRLAQSEQDLQALVLALEKDRTHDDRVSAIMAIGNSQLKGEMLQAKLIERVSDRDEVWEVRSYAADALDRFNLEGQDLAAYLSFRKEQDIVRNQS